MESYTYFLIPIFISIVFAIFAKFFTLTSSPPVGNYDEISVKKWIKIYKYIIIPCSLLPAYPIAIFFQYLAKNHLAYYFKDSIIAFYSDSLIVWLLPALFFSLILFGGLFFEVALKFILNDDYDAFRWLYDSEYGFDSNKIKFPILILITFLVTTISYFVLYYHLVFFQDKISYRTFWSVKDKSVAYDQIEKLVRCESIKSRNGKTVYGLDLRLKLRNGEEVSLRNHCHEFSKHCSGPNNDIFMQVEKLILSKITISAESREICD